MLRRLAPADHTLDERAGRAALRRLAAEDTERFAAERTPAPSERAVLARRAAVRNADAVALTLLPDDLDTGGAGKGIETIDLSGGLSTDTGIGSDGRSTAMVERTAERDPERAYVRFLCRAAGEAPGSRFRLNHHVGFRYAFTPPHTGRYRIAPVAVLRGSWLAGSLDTAGSASLRVALRVRTAQFVGGADGGHAYDDHLVVDADPGFGVDGATFDVTIDADTEGPVVIRRFTGGVRVEVLVGCAINIETTELGFADVNGDGSSLGLDVLDVYATSLDRDVGPHGPGLFPGPLDPGDLPPAA